MAGTKDASGFGGFYPFFAADGIYRVRRKKKRGQETGSSLDAPKTVN
jgi:hypothetical protein